jgi:hypothetical protein
VTLLKANPYRGVKDFEDLSEARRLRDPRTGETTHRVAEGGVPRSEGRRLRCAVSRDLENGRWVGFVTTVKPTAQPDIVAMARWYIPRWPAQEGSFRDLNEWVKMELNFGVQHKQAVANRVQARRQEKREQQLQGHQARLAAQEKRSTPLQERIQREEQRLEQFVAGLSGRRLQERGPARRQAQQAQIPARLRKWQAQRTRLEDQQKVLEQKVQAVQTDLAALPAEAPLWEVEAEKDQRVTPLKVGAAAAVQWAQEFYFGEAYQESRPGTLQRRFLNLEKRPVCVSINARFGPWRGSYCRFTSLTANNSRNGLASC